MAQTHHTKVLIIGSGAAGYTAGIYAARANLKPEIVAGLQPGGQMTITTDVENYPGFGDVIQGPWLMEEMRKQAESVGTVIHYDLITEVDLSARPFRAVGDSGDLYTGDTIVIATGAQARWLGLEGEQTYHGRGVSACATCDGFFYRDQEVVVVGGGNTAVEEALYLSNICSKVTLVHRRDKLRAEKIGQERLFRNDKISVVWDSVVDEILGGAAPQGAVEGVRVRNVKSGETQEIPCAGFFVAIGHDPATAVFKGQVDMDEEGYVLTRPDSTLTNLPGVFAAGDVKDRVYRQAVTAAGMGCMAALDAERFLAEQEAATAEAAE